jgi:hypothetical protein
LTTIDAAYSEVMQAGGDVPRLREVLRGIGADKALLVGVLRRPVPVRLLELLASPPWSDDQRLMGAVVLNPAAPRSLALRLVGGLAWRDLADVAASPRLSGAVRVRAEGLLKDQLADLRLGDRITLGKIATPPILGVLLEDPDSRVAEACLINPRLREEDLVFAIRRDTAPRALLERVAASSRWKDRYAVRVALVLQPRTPLPVALGQISSLLKKDLVRISETEGLVPLLQVAAGRVAASQD